MSLATFIPSHAYARLVAYAHARALGENPDRLDIDRAFLSPGARQRVEVALNEASLDQFDPIDPVNATRILLGERADIWPDSIFAECCAPACDQL